jgi:hypothetical protein
MGFFEELLDNNSIDTEDLVDCFTELKSADGLLIRANPCYKNERPWHDWVNINLDGSVIPIHIIMFIDLCDLKEPYIQGDGLPAVVKPGTYAMAHRVPVPLDTVEYDETGNVKKNYLAHQTNLLFYWMTKKVGLDRDRKRRPKIALFDLDAVYHSPCIAVPDLDSSVKHSFIFMKSKKYWKTIFEQEIIKALQNAPDGKIPANDDDESCMEEHEDMSKIDEEDWGMDDQLAEESSQNCDSEAEDEEDENDGKSEDEREETEDGQDDDQESLEQAE